MACFQKKSVLLQKITARAERFCLIFVKWKKWSKGFFHFPTFCCNFADGNSEE